VTIAPAPLRRLIAATLITALATISMPVGVAHADAMPPLPGYGCDQPLPEDGRPCPTRRAITTRSPNPLHRNVNRGWADPQPRKPSRRNELVEGASARSYPNHDAAPGCRPGSTYPLPTTNASSTPPTHWRSWPATPDRRSFTSRSHSSCSIRRSPRRSPRTLDHLKSQRLHPGQQGPGHHRGAATAHRTDRLRHGGPARHLVPHIAATHEPPE
jgi:hypothetical protein